jgi:hypothetical protein
VRLEAGRRGVLSPGHGERHQRRHRIGGHADDDEARGVAPEEVGDERRDEAPHVRAVPAAPQRTVGFDLDAAAGDGRVLAVATGELADELDEIAVAAPEARRRLEKTRDVARLIDRRRETTQVARGGLEALGRRRLVDAEADAERVHLALERKQRLRQILCERREEPVARVDRAAQLGRGGIALGSVGVEGHGRRDRGLGHVFAALAGAVVRPHLVQLPLDARAAVAAKRDLGTLVERIRAGIAAHEGQRMDPQHVA